MHLKNVVWKIAAILSGPQCVKVSVGRIPYVCTGLQALNSQKSRHFACINTTIVTQMCIMYNRVPVVYFAIQV